MSNFFLNALFSLAERIFEIFKERIEKSSVLQNRKKGTKNIEMSEMGKSWREEILEPLNLALLAASGTWLLIRQRVNFKLFSRENQNSQKQYFRMADL